MYSWGLYYLGHRFCSTCGTPVYIEMLPKMEETMKEKSEEDKKFAMNKVCINANIINDAEWDKIKIGDCLAGERGPKYTVD